MKKELIIYVIAVFGILVISNCTNSKQKSNDEENIEVEVAKTGFNNFESSFSGISPEEVMTLFEDSDLEYKSEILNKPEKVDGYLTSKSLSYNLGVYVMDATYLNMFKQYSEMTSYLETIFKITDALEINGIYREFDFKKIFMEMDNPDSLIVLSEGIYLAITNYMTENNNESMLCLISTGSFVELLYLTMESIDEFDSEDPILQHISDQYMQLDNLYEFAMQYSDYPDMEQTIGYLSEIRDVMNVAEIVEDTTLVSNTDDGKMLIGGGKKHVFSEEQFLELKQIVKEIRNKITA